MRVKQSFVSGDDEDFMSWASQIRDPVHGFIGLTKKEVSIVNSAPLQRLRGIRQLAMANLLYPGALHTRFDHTLGVMHVAGLLCEALGLNSERELIRLAALLHDIGHGPFSHVSEAALEFLADRTVLPEETKKEKIHELVTAIAIETDESISKFISTDDRESIIQLLKQGYDERVVRDVISGPLDADKQDYLLRDSYFCGVRYGVFDLHQLHRSLLNEKDGKDACMMVEPDGIHALEQFVLAKYYLTTQVYRHRVRLVTDQMLTRAIILGVTVDQIQPLSELYVYDGTPEFVRNYQQWDDARFLLTFGSEDFKGTLCYNLVNMLRERRLLKSIFDESLKDFQQAEVKDKVSSFGKPQSRQDVLEVEKRVAELLSVITKSEILPEMVIVHVYSIKSVREQARNDEKSILIATRPTPRQFDQESTLFESIDERMSEQRMQIFAPVNYRTYTERRRIVDDARTGIEAILTDISTREVTA